MNVLLLRWLAAALLVLNLAYYWYASQLANSVPTPAVPVVGAQRLLLVSELPRQQASLPGSESALTSVDTASPPGASAATSNASSQDLQCWELGPLDKGLQIDLAQLFERIELPMRRFERGETDATDYRVYLAVNGRQQRAEYQRRLNDAGVENYVIGGGELEGNVSLGLFTSRERAEAVASPLQALKLPVVIHSRQRRQNQTWLRLNSREIAALGWSPGLANLTLWPRPAILAVSCEDDAQSVER